MQIKYLDSVLPRQRSPFTRGYPLHKTHTRNRIKIRQNSFPNPSKSLQKCSRNRTRTVPKSIKPKFIFPTSFQNPCNFFSKSTKIDPKSCPKSILSPKRVPKASRTRFFQFFFRFFDGPGLPKIEPKSEKIEKKTPKNRC